jgi:arginase family enzyme
MPSHDRPAGAVTQRGVRVRDFLAANQRFLGLDDRQADPDESEIIVLPVPFERTSSFGIGSAAGPESILRA